MAAVIKRVMIQKRGFLMISLLSPWTRSFILRVRWVAMDGILNNIIGIYSASASNRRTVRLCLAKTPSDFKINKIR